MFSINKAFIVGTLGADPEVRSTGNGNQVANLRVATEDSWKNKDTGNYDKKTEWHKITAWGPFAKQAEKLHKGDKVTIEGKIETRKYTDKDGNEKYTTEIVVIGINASLIGHPKSGDGNSNSSHTQKPATTINQDMDDDSDIPF